jgi:hypothetical protein
MRYYVCMALSMVFLNCAQAKESAVNDPGDSLLRNFSNRLTSEGKAIKKNEKTMGVLKKNNMAADQYNKIRSDKSLENIELAARLEEKNKNSLSRHVANKFRSKNKKKPSLAGDIKNLTEERRGLVAQNSEFQGHKKRSEIGKDKANQIVKDIDSRLVSIDKDLAVKKKQKKQMLSLKKMLKRKRLKREARQKKQRQKA